MSVGIVDLARLILPMKSKDFLLVVRSLDSVRVLVGFNLPILFRGLVHEREFLQEEQRQTRFWNRRWICRESENALTIWGAIVKAALANELVGGNAAKHSENGIGVLLVGLLGVSPRQD